MGAVPDHYSSQTLRDQCLNVPNNEAFEDSSSVTDPLCVYPLST